jgi:hypothetical protein
MSIIDSIKGNPFEKLKKDEIITERIRLERDEKLKIGEVERLSAEKKDLFDKGFQASDGEKRALARKIQQLDQKIKLDNIQLKKISDDIRVVDNLTFIHDNKKALERAGLMSKVAKMPKSKLDEFLAKVNLQDSMRTGNTDALLRTMEDEYGLMDESADDKETTKLMDIWSTSDSSKSSEIYERWDKEKAGKEKESA